MNSRHRAPALVAAAVATGVMTAAMFSFAEGTDDRATVSALVLKLQQDAHQAPVIAMALARAKEALDRAARLRGSGDEAHARTADALAREWAETARDLALAADAEQKASGLRRKAVDAQAGLERTSALVEEAIARAGRLRSELEAASRPTSKDRP
jgi:hypothetical protein